MSTNAEKFRSYFNDTVANEGPYQYEDDLLVWKGDQWRQLNSRERASMLGFPKDYLNPEVAPDISCE